jgi:hypothetical protein
MYLAVVMSVVPTLIFRTVVVTMRIYQSRLSYPDVPGMLERTRSRLFDPESLVLLAAIVAAPPTAYYVQQWLDSGFAASFLVLVILGVSVPQLYDRWPHQYKPSLAVAWTLAACTVMTVVFVATYLVATNLGAGTLTAAILVFLVTELGSSGLTKLWSGAATSE